MTHSLTYSNVRTPFCIDRIKPKAFSTWKVLPTSTPFSGISYHLMTTYAPFLGPFKCKFLERTIPDLVSRPSAKVEGGSLLCCDSPECTLLLNYLLLYISDLLVYSAFSTASCMRADTMSCSSLHLRLLEQYQACN